MCKLRAYDARRTYWSTFDAAPVSWATADKRVLREVGASIDAAEWVLLGELARGANQLKGKDRPMVLPADKLPTELRYPNQRFGVEPPGHLASAGAGRRRADAPAAVGLRARPSARPQAQRDLPARRPAVAARTVAVTGTLLAVGGALFVLSGQCWGPARMARR